jgi:hypothetical protein
MTYEEARHRVERGTACGQYTSAQARRLQAEIGLLQRNNLPLSDWGQLEAFGRTSDWADSFSSWVRRRSRARALRHPRRVAVLLQPRAETRCMATLTPCEVLPTSPSWSHSIAAAVAVTRLTEQAYHVTGFWDNAVNFTSTNVNGVQSKFNGSV